MVRQGSDQVALPKFPSINAAMSHNDEIGENTVFRASRDSDFLFQTAGSWPGSLVVSKGSREQATQLIFPLFHPTILLDKATCLPSEEIQTSAEDRWLSGWDCGVGGASLQSVRTSFPFWKPPLPATLENSHTANIWKKRRKSWITFGLIFVAFTPVPTQLRRQTGGFQSEGLPHTPISRALTSNRCFAGIPLILSPYFLFAFIVHTFVLFVCVFVIHKTEIIHMYNLQFKIWWPFDFEWVCDEMYWVIVSNNIWSFFSFLYVIEWLRFFYAQENQYCSSLAR